MKINEVFTLTMYNSDSHTEQFIYSSKNIFDIINKMYENSGNINEYKIYVTSNDGDTIPYKEWVNNIYMKNR